MELCSRQRSRCAFQSLKPASWVFCHSPTQHAHALTGAAIQVALSHSLPLKEAELGVSGLTLWGRVQVLNGKDYLIAQASESMHVIDNAVHSSTMYLFSQDGIEWATLGAVTASNRQAAANMLTMLGGDPQKKHYWPPKSEEQEDAGAAAFGCLRGCCEVES